MKSVKRAFAVMLVILLFTVVGYLVFTGSRLTELHETAKEVVYVF